MPGAARYRQRPESAAGATARNAFAGGSPTTGTQIPPDVIAPADRNAEVPRNDNLSDKLSRQQGILQPPAVDPGIHAPMPPDTKEIPPPGSPGGNPRVVPK